MKSICGMKTPESDMILNFIKNHIKDSNFHVRWDWEEGDLAIWDERSTNHKGLTFHYPSTRKVRRCTVKGDRPYFDPKAKAEDAEPMIKRPSRELEIMVDE